jgi:hypothetical protein
VTAGDGTIESTAGMVESAMESNSLIPVSSMYKLNKSMASLKPPVLSGVDPVERRKRPSIAGVGVSMTIGDADLTMFGDAESTLIGDAE